jgi:signal transduction histidine kinase/CheY-like chemotaxis protein
LRRSKCCCASGSICYCFVESNLQVTGSKDVEMNSELREASVSFEQVDFRSELKARPSRPPNYAAEHRALALLAKEMADNPRNMLQKVVEMAVELCAADTAGISILEGDVFRWESLAGVLAPYLNNTLPRDASPCGVCIDQNATQLMYLPDRCFPALSVEPRAVEALLVPFQHHGKPVGTVWIVAHTNQRKFDREDERIVRTLSGFAAAGWQLWKAFRTEAESSKKKDEFLAMLGHELRNPLAAIVSANNVMQNVGIQEPKALRAMEVVARQSKHLGRMVDDLIDLTRISHGKLKLQRERIELRIVLNQVLDTTRAQMEACQHRLSVRVPPEPIILNADPVRLAQMVANLLDNAAKYTPAGGEISITAEPRDDQAFISVRDSGVGIRADQVDEIFDLFTQLDVSQTAKSRGLGMGLSLVRNLAELHGGSVDVVSSGAGQGSLFTIRLPISPAPSLTDVAKKRVDESAASNGGHRILLVEDDDDVAESMGALLALDGHTVNIANDGAIALDMMRSFEPNVVLLDLGLPGLDGYQVARRIRTETLKKNIVIIALSGYGEEEHRRRSKEAGCDGHLVKPVQPDVLRKLLAGTWEYEQNTLVLPTTRNRAQAQGRM